VTRSALLVTHTQRRHSAQHARSVALDLLEAGFEVRVLAEDVANLELPAGVSVVDGPAAAEGVEIVFALGGDGTFLRAAELARPAKAPMLGINLGKVGFLAVAETGDIDHAVREVVAGTYTVHERLTLDVRAEYDGRTIAESWALNEVSVEKGQRAQMLELLVDVDGRPLSRYGCDGVVCATPTGSTAYAFSAGGPVVWPEVEALLLVPISAHALFSRPLVTAPTSEILVTVDPYTSLAVLTCDGRRCYDLPPGARVTVRRGELPVRVVRLEPQPFTDRLVAKFALPVEGWRGNARGVGRVRRGREGRGVRLPLTAQRPLSGR
jgi:NAD+ kinase